MAVETMDDLLRRLQDLRRQAVEQIQAATSLEELERWRVAYLGKKGALTDVLRGLGRLPSEQRPAVGQAANQVKEELEALLAAREAAIKEAVLTRALEAERVDVTLPGRRPALGGYHPTTLVLRRIVEIFQGLGFQVVEGPEVELDYYNFEALNIPADHPARDMWDTFYISPPEVLLRTHTSPMQVRVMEQTEPPVRVVVPGRCYRYEAQDASHEWMFYQVEGLAVDEGLTMADLMGTLTSFAQEMFWPDVRCRFRCDYFPFVEP
ncbi:MAG TPA: phenylalanine--tRNA ligase subunit alpha, partial [Chloroflexota bacterium]